MAIQIKELLSRLPGSGEVVWIGLRPAKREAMRSVSRVEAALGQGLEGDRYTSSRGAGKREVTLIQAEHLDAIASYLGLDALDPAILRRNIAVRGINLLALKNRRFSIGGAVLEMTGLCHPCSRMEEIFGEGGYNAVRGHGGITARVVEPGDILLGDKVSALPPE